MHVELTYVELPAVLSLLWQIEVASPTARFLLMAKMESFIANSVELNELKAVAEKHADQFAETLKLPVQIVTHRENPLT